MAISNIRNHKAFLAAGLAAPTKVEGKADPRYTGAIIHDLRRSAIKNQMKAGTSERVAMAISGHKKRDVSDQYHIVDYGDVVEVKPSLSARRSRLLAA